MWLALSTLMLLSGCDRVPAETHQAVVQERDALRARVKAVEDELDKAKGEIALARKDLEKVQKTAGRPPEPQIAAARSQLKLPPNGKVKALLKTSLGEISCELWPDIAPETVMNFVGLAEGTKEWTEPKSGNRVTKPLYDGTKFHRVIKGFMIQGGDPLGDGTGGPGFKFGDEVWPDVRFDKPGLLAMANAGPGTNGSQFFITVGKPSNLNMRHTIFGECNPEVAIKISEVEVSGSAPVKEVILEKVTISRDSGEAPADKPAEKAPDAPK